MSSMITAIAWVPRGHAAAFPTKYVFDEDEYGRIAKLAKLQLEDAEEDLEEAREAEGERNGAEAGISTEKGGKSKNLKGEEESDDDDMKKYNLEHYDSSDEESENENGTKMGMFGNLKDLAYHSNNTDDPYITLEAAQEEEDEDREDMQILPTDNLLLAARIEDEIAHLEVYVYEDDVDNLYVHHDIMLPAYPLCVEWLNHAAGSRTKHSDGANYAAVGTMDPDIEVWDLDTVDCMYPNAILGAGGLISDETGGGKKKKRHKSRKKPNDAYHVDAVLSLSANKLHRNLLASSSADTTVKLWDLNTAKCAQSYSMHSDKICATAWHPKEATVLLTGSYDRSVVATDMRAPGAKAPRWNVESDVEMVQWDGHSDETFYVSTESGMIHCHDVRSDGQKALWTLQAHDEPVTSFAMNLIIPGFIATGSTDKTVKLWSLNSSNSVANGNTGSGPTMVVSRNMDVGKVFSVGFAPDSEVGFRLAVAGSNGTLRIWDTSTNGAVRRIFGDRVANGVQRDVKERVIGLEEVDEDDDENNEPEDEEEGGVALEPGSSNSDGDSDKMVE